MTYKTMYPAQPGSPQTALATALSANATTMVLEDTSVLPPAPNLAVIGSEPDAEVVLYTAITDNVVSGLVRGQGGTTPQAWGVGEIVARNITSYDHNAFKENIETIFEEIGDIKEDVSDIDDRLIKAESDLADLAAQMAFKRYGVSGVGQSANALTRLYDAVGLTAQVGTDGDNSSVVNDFDSAGPFMRRKCVGTWSIGENGRAVFNVTAYYGDPNYAEDGSAGDYVAVECPLTFYYHESGIWVVSLHQYPGYRPFDIFCRNHDENDLIPKVYLPCYALSINGDGYAVSLPGYDNEQNHYQGLMNTARTYNNAALGLLAMLEPAAVKTYEEVLFTIEFATQNCQSIMKGCSELRSNNADLATFQDETHILLNNYAAGRVVGEYVAIIANNIDINHASYKPTHRIVSITRCDSTGTEDNSGTYSLIELEDLGKNYYNYDLTGVTTYRCAARPWRTGECNGVSTPSGSPNSNSNGYYPMKYRWRENIFGNQYMTVSDLFDQRIADGDSYHLDWFLLTDPTQYVPASSSKPDATDLASDLFAKLDVQTAVANYVNGYIKSKLYSEDYPDIWIPHETADASGSTFYCDYAYLVHSHAVRACRFGGNVSNGAYAGLSNLSANSAPSSANAFYGGSLCFAQ